MLVACGLLCVGCLFGRFAVGLFIWVCLLYFVWCLVCLLSFCFEFWVLIADFVILFTVISLVVVLIWFVTLMFVYALGFVVFGCFVV